MSKKYCAPLARITIWDGVFDAEKSVLKRWSNLTSYADLGSAIKELDDKSTFRIKYSITVLTRNLKMEKLKQEHA